MDEKPKNHIFGMCSLYSFKGHLAGFYTYPVSTPFEGLLFTEKFRKYEFSLALAMAARGLSLTRRELKPVYQRFKNNFKLSDDQLKEKYEAIEREFDEEFDKAMGGVQ